MLAILLDDLENRPPLEGYSIPALPEKGGCPAWPIPIAVHMNSFLQSPPPVQPWGQPAALHAKGVRPPYAALLSACSPAIIAYSRALLSKAVWHIALLARNRCDLWGD
jgi:hypothetical protein